MLLGLSTHYTKGQVILAAVVGHTPKSVISRKFPRSTPSRPLLLYCFDIAEEKKKAENWLPPLFLSFPPPWTALPLRQLTSTSKSKQSKQQCSKWHGKPPLVRKGKKKGKGKAAEASNDQAIGPNTRRTMEAPKKDIHSK